MATSLAVSCRDVCSVTSRLRSGGGRDGSAFPLDPLAGVFGWRAISLVSWCRRAGAGGPHARGLPRRTSLMVSRSLLLAFPLALGLADDGRDQPAGSLLPGDRGGPGDGQATAGVIPDRGLFEPPGRRLRGANPDGRVATRCRCLPDGGMRSGSRSRTPNGESSSTPLAPGRVAFRPRPGGLAPSVPPVLGERFTQR